MSVKDNWKATGKGLGKSFAGLGKSIVQPAKVGLDRANGDIPLDKDGNPKDTNLMESWSKVGHSFGETGKSLGKAAAGTAKKVANKVDNAAED